MFSKTYDVIVVGGGHSGCEAAAAAGNLGSSVLLVTMNMQTIAQMSCNPAMGGVAKGQIVREIDALGGYSGIITDKTMIQFRMLNRSKGPAMWSPRAQSDRVRFAEEWRLTLESIKNVDFWQDMVTDLIVENGKVVGVKTGMEIEIKANSVILTSGTFLNGTIHIGEKQFGGGRTGERAATGLTACLNALGFESGRMKTGTPPRVDGRSLDYCKMEEQQGDINPSKFSFLDTPRLQTQRSCHITYTNQEAHDVLRTGFERSPMFNGRILGLGPRYCPSIEDKIERFSERDRHQIFVEPEGWDTIEVYVNGFSTSLPEDVQHNAIRLIPGFENAKIFRPGYAIEYDYFPPTQLRRSLETKLVKGLYFAGQINGTTGYEEAACQGLMAGINAHRKVNSEEPIILSRSEAYIGVLIDDLVTKGTDEPYRMFTSRAEYRILLRQDNADIRLTQKGREIGLVKDLRMAKLEEKLNNTKKALDYFETESISPDDINPILEINNSSPIKQKNKVGKILSRPQIKLDDLLKVKSVEQGTINIGNEGLEQAEIQIKYNGYIEREKETVLKLNKLEGIRIPKTFDYSKLNAISSESREKLNHIKPETIGQASRISGVSPSDINILLVFMGR
ncbi:MAG: tRNA uridine-5-carboxymethylaminomethyl(34) synthesis enzyme MnmG [Flavobacteriales bacterium]|nr:tRNA uridine-5-carboxymethylaminomethyl(34) synthesis enzyme MnmG [Flavobacteriales bacterium]|tara:strand:- start:14705 stop:16567 length:1863 start_codon:yes stop_codon:yes gene_type:complete